MSLITQRAKETLEQESIEVEVPAPIDKPYRSIDLSQWLAVGLVALATIAAIAYLVMALEYRGRPFLGLLVDQDLEVQNAASFTDEHWPGLALGIETGDKIIGTNERSFPSSNGITRLNEALDAANTGEDLVLVIAREGAQSGIPGADRCSLNAEQTLTICSTPITLDTMPLVDFVGFFGIGYVVGLIALGISILILVRRFHSSSAHFFSALSAMAAIVVMGRFNFLSSHQELMAYLWIFAGTLLSGLMISFSIVFPNPMPVSERIPAIKYAPLLVALVLGAIFAALDEQGEPIALALPLVLVVVGAVGMVMNMIWQRQYTSSPIFREQAGYVMLGTVFGITPLALWLLYRVLNENASSIWIIPLVQILSLLLLVSIAYALLQERLLETDQLVPTLLVYNLLGGILIVGYAAVVWGLSSIGITSVSSDSPVFIALVVLVIAVGFIPIRAYLHERINEIWFRRNRQYQQRLEGLLSKLTNAITVNEVEQAVRTAIDELLAPSDVILFVRDKEAQVFRAYESAGKTVTDVTFPFNSGLPHYLESEASILYLEEGKPLPPKLMENRAQLAVLNTPIMVRLMGQRQLNGYIAISARRNGSPYGYDDLQFIEKVADQAALSLERTRIVEDLEHRFRVQDVLSQVSRSLSYAIDFDTLMELLYAQTSRVIEADIFGIAMVESNASQLFYAFFVEGDERLSRIEQHRWDFGRDLVSQVAHTQQLLRVDDYSSSLQQRNPAVDLASMNIKAWMGAPLTTDMAGGTLGVMVVGTHDPTIRYSEEQVQLFLDIASLAASAINKTRLFEATQLRTQQLEALNQISSQLSTAIGDVDNLLDLITRSALDILNCQAGSLLLVDEESGDLVFRVALGPGAQELVGQRIPKDRPSLANEALKRAESVIVNDTTVDSRWHGEVLRDDEEEENHSAITFHSRAILTTPLLTQGAPIGVLQIINKRDGSPFTNDDATLLTTFAAQAAVAIQNARLYALQDERLIRRVAELEGLAAIDQTLNKTLELPKVVGITLDWAIRQSGAKAGAIAMIESEDGSSMRLIASQGYPEGAKFAAEAVDEKFSTQIGVWGRVIRTATPSFSRNLLGSKDGTMPPDPDYIETFPGAVSQIIMPIISVGGVIGILLVESDNETDLTLLDMEFLTRLADHASPAIANAQLFDQLRFQQEARAEFVSFIAHELKTPMTSMKGYTDLLMRGVVGPLNEQQSNFLNTIFTNVNRLEALVNDLRDVEAQDANQLKLEMGSVDFAQIVRESLRPLQQAFEKKEQQVDLVLPDNLPLVWADQKRVIQIMTNFLTNGNKYTPVGGTVTVMAEKALNEWDKEGVRQVLHVQVKDTGIGITEEDQQKLFKEKYFRTQNAIDTDEPGTGLGMVLTRGLILQHGGQVWLESAIGKGSIFHFTLPIADEIMREAT